MPRFDLAVVGEAVIKRQNIEACGHEAFGERLMTAGSPVYAELMSLVRKAIGVVPTLPEGLAPLHERIVLALVFACVATQTDGAASDLDLLVFSDTVIVGELLPLVIEAEAALGRKVNPTCGTPREFERRRKDPYSFVNPVLAQPTLTLRGEVDDPAAAG